MINKMGRVLDHIEEFLIGLSLIGMVIICFANVLARYVFQMSLGFSEELLVIFFIYNSLIGASIGVRKKSHLGFTALVEKVPKKYRKILLIITHIGTILLLIALLYFGFLMCKNQYHYNLKTSALRMPEYFAGAAIPISATLIIIRTFQSLIKSLKSAEY